MWRIRPSRVSPHRYGSSISVLVPSATTMTAETCRNCNSFSSGQEQNRALVSGGIPTNMRNWTFSGAVREYHVSHYGESDALNSTKQNHCPPNAQKRVWRALFQNKFQQERDMYHSLLKYSFLLQKRHYSTNMTQQQRNSKTAQQGETTSESTPIDESSQEQGDSSNDGGQNNNGKRNKDRKLWKNLWKLLSLSKRETKLFIVGFISLIITSASSMYLPLAIGSLVNVIVSTEDEEKDQSESGFASPANFSPLEKMKENMFGSPSASSLENTTQQESSGDTSPAGTTGEISQESHDKLKHATLKLMGIFAIGTIAIAFRISAIQIIGLRMQARLRKELFHRIIRRDMSFFDKRQSGELINRLGTDVTLMSDLLTRSVVSGVKSTLEAGISIGLLCYLSTKLTLTAMSLIPPTAIIAVLYGRYIRKLYKDYTDALAAANSHAAERFTHIRTVKSFVSEKKELDVYSSKVDNSYMFGKNAAMASGIFHSAIFGATGIALITVLYGGGMMTLQGLMTVGDLTSFMLYSIYAGSSFSSLSSVYGDISRALGSSERVFTLLDEESENEKIDTGIIPEQMIGEIEFKNVSFTYPSRPDARILENFSVHIPAGSFTALVSESGQGKSTLTHLLARLYETESGSISIDGHNVKDLNVEWLRNHIAIVPQEPVLFQGTIREQVLYANPSATEEELREAISLAQCDFVWSFPDGLDTVISNTSLSGGQKQRLAIARAILKKDARILILDEYSSSLDSKSEAALTVAIQNLLRTKTVLLITHRLSSVRKADQILVLHEGQLIQQGTHEELLKQKEGKYALLVDKQFKTD